jgi:hypothetical protein
MGLVLRYGARKTCCWSPAFPQGDSEAEIAERKTCSALPAAVLRLAGGMHVLGSFVGTDDFVIAEALRLVESDAPSSIATAARVVTLLAASATRNSRDIATALLRSCVVSKLTYLCRTPGPAAGGGAPRPAAAGARRHQLPGPPYPRHHGHR